MDQKLSGTIMLVDGKPQVSIHTPELLAFAQKYQQQHPDRCKLEQEEDRRKGW